VEVRNFITRRVLQLIPLFVGISFITFWLLTLQGDPFHQLLLNPHIKAEDVARLMHQWNWDKPFLVRYFYWVKEFVTSTFVPSHGNGWGFSILAPGQTARALILQKIPMTLTLGISSLVFAFVIALPIGIYSAIRQYSIGDYIGTFFAFFGMSMPAFWFGLMLLLLFGLKLGWLPIGGMHTDLLTVSGSQVDFYAAPWIMQIGDRAKHLILPVVVLSLMDVGSWMRYIRSSMLEVIRQDYIRTARAKGATERTILFKHALRNAMTPIITLIGLSLPSLLAGAMITEQVFSLDGMGRLTIQAVLGNDIFVGMAIVMMDAILVMSGSLLADILYAVVDPRIRYS
jgi:peptide/nickel transport system permease protein